MRVDVKNGSTMARVLTATGVLSGSDVHLVDIIAEREAKTTNQDAMLDKETRKFAALTV
jgi:hypothetical protein